jgi:hypothetical protein
MKITGERTNQSIKLLTIPETGLVRKLGKRR